MSDGQGRLKSTPLALAGAGRLGAALLAGWRAHGLADDVLLIEKDSARVESLAGGGVRSAPTLSSADLSRLQALVVAVKPQHVAHVAEEVSPSLSPGVLLISVAAGVTLRELQDLFPQGRIVRAMPNTAAAVGRSITAYVAANDMNASHRSLTETLLGAFGAVVEAPDEAAMDAVTAVSGSGPAYVYAFVEALAAAGEAQGLPRALAEKLARETVIGAGAMLAASAESPENLRIAVTSRGGTTQAGLNVWMGADPSDADPATVFTLLEDTVSAAAARSRAMATREDR